jgi:hypothetical protein
MTCIAANGWLERWNQFNIVKATIVTQGEVAL